LCRLKRLTVFMTHIYIKYNETSILKTKYNSRCFLTVTVRFNINNLENYRSPEFEYKRVCLTQYNVLEF
jgi:hypothetical protein